MYENLKYHDGTGNGWHYCLDYVKEPQAILYDGDLIDVDGFVHVVCGKVICWNKEDLSLDDPYIFDLIDYAKNTLYKNDYIIRKAGYGSVVFLVLLTLWTRPEERFAETRRCIDELPDVLRHNIKLCCPYYEENGY